MGAMEAGNNQSGLKREGEINSIGKADYIWYVCFVKEEGKRVYELFLNDRYFDKEHYFYGKEQNLKKEAFD